LLAPAQRRRHEREYGKDYSPDVIFFSHSGAVETIYVLRGTQHIGNHVSRSWADRYSLSDLFNLKTKDF
jgi:hypothetical protein